ncbi:MAG: TonB family protein [Lysobacteraceae bacterium]|nr:MAG: TonB family protein [Xanthomonadaceae bacterium]
MSRRLHSAGAIGAAFCALLAAAVGAGAAETAEAGKESAVRKLSFSAEIEVDPAGGVRAGEVRGIAPQLQEWVRGKLGGIKLLPARDQLPGQVARSQLGGQLVLTPMAGDAYAIDVESLQVAPRFLARAVPHYPPAMIRGDISGAALLETRIGGDGRVLSARIVHATREEFSGPVLAAARQWKLEPQFLAGQPVEVVMQWPILFAVETCRTPSSCAHDSAAPGLPDGWACQWDGSLPRVAGQPACADAIEIRGSRVRRNTSPIEIR